MFGGPKYLSEMVRHWKQFSLYLYTGLQMYLSMYLCLILYFENMMFWGLWRWFGSA